MTETTLTKYADRRARNYERLPVIDVPILPDVHRCRVCEGLVHYVRSETRPITDSRWMHSAAETDHRADPMTRCSYCHDMGEGVRYVQHSWHDAVECERCGGQDGYAIGD